MTFHTVSELGNATIFEAVLRKPWETAKAAAVQGTVFGGRKPHPAMELPLQLRSQVQLGNEAKKHRPSETLCLSVFVVHSNNADMFLNFGSL